MNLSAFADNSFSSSDRVCFEPGQIAHHMLVKRPKLQDARGPLGESIAKKRGPTPALPLRPPRTRRTYFGSG